MPCNPILNLNLCHYIIFNLPLDFQGYTVDDRLSLKTLLQNINIVHWRGFEIILFDNKTAGPAQ